jgi:hypothetical protein
MKLLADESLRRAIVKGLLFLRPATVFQRAQEVGLRGKPDPEVLEWAAANDCIVVTHDRATFSDFAYERVAANLYMPGVFVVGNHLPTGRAIEDLHLLVECSHPSEWDSRVLHLPLTA